jgi:hypothetical protein
VALIRTDVSEDRIASIFRVHECEQITERSCKLLYGQRLVEARILYGLLSAPLPNIHTPLSCQRDFLLILDYTLLPSLWLFYDGDTG